jgi:hypothetical protein
MSFAMVNKNYTTLSFPVGTCRVSYYGSGKSEVTCDSVNFLIHKDRIEMINKEDQHTTPSTHIREFFTNIDIVYSKANDGTIVKVDITDVKNHSNYVAGIHCNGINADIEPGFAKRSPLQMFWTSRVLGINTYQFIFTGRLQSYMPLFSLLKRQTFSSSLSSNMMCDVTTLLLKIIVL